MTAACLISSSGVSLAKAKSAESSPMLACSFSVQRALGGGVGEVDEVADTFEAGASGFAGGVFLPKSLLNIFVCLWSRSRVRIVPVSS